MIVRTVDDDDVHFIRGRQDTPSCEDIPPLKVPIENSPQIKFTPSFACTKHQPHHGPVQGTRYKYQ